jgi:hypothetical protein
MFPVRYKLSSYVLMGRDLVCIRVKQIMYKAIKEKKI